MSIKKSIKKTWKRITRNANVRDGVEKAASTLGTLLLAALKRRVAR
jgi:hypothetical protein